MLQVLLFAATAAVSVPREFTDAYDRITLGNEVQSEVGEWTLENAGTVIAWRRVQLVSGRTMADETLRRRVSQRLVEAFPRARLKVTVSNGIVSLRGRASSRERAGAVLWTTLRTPGVEEVRSFVTWPDPRPAR